MASYGEDKPTIVQKGSDTKMIFDLDEFLHNPDKMKKASLIGGVVLIALLLLLKK